ncbi:acetyl-CoA carboxylase biotin carboxyl carrier protein subunit [Anaerocolumna cellulosilytica]|uniref:Acetyl-CoA carboxylase biotin carboxyl carrier protein subunit n=1 Tax=Anaerocolumna cellulosilytica TaxID=433286 RepID=A0A6S6R6J4_9FIRM|nr:biotin/lipoyl-containing protein [Anaerocolumna cellulosilytica]MBB5197575.1 glutaconyl-CoA decarboxylase [Anaerocolumna cellulosilytica]BCJ95100.1 acetyl-CoA carboxylase biotin carboxyl carrier protein subunit [Anaerocolumna cellulosilytica]
MKNYIITVNGTAYEVSVEEGSKSSTSPAQVYTEPAKAVTSTPKMAPVPTVKAQEPKVEEPKAAPASVQTASAGAIKVNSPMPGKILALKANIGQTVKRGDVILILEAMKMENEIVAPEPGTVASIDVTVGDMVEAGVLLATLK